MVESMHDRDVAWRWTSLSLPIVAIRSLPELIQNSGAPSWANKPCLDPISWIAMGGAWISQVADWQNSSVIEINKRRAHVPLKSYTSPSQPLQHYASISATPASPRVLVLNGEHWRFKLFDRPEDVPQAFHDPQHPDQDWAQVRPAAGQRGTTLRGCSRPAGGGARLIVPTPAAACPCR
jgi:hypothetical protein